MSIHPTTTNAEITYVCDSIIALAKHHHIWAKDDDYSKCNNEFTHKSMIVKPCAAGNIDSWFDLSH